MAQLPMAGQGLLIIEASPSHSHTQHSVGRLWASDQLDVQASTSQEITFTGDRYPGPRQDSNPRSQQTSGRKPTPLTALSLYLLFDSDKD